MRIGLFTDTYPPYINGVSTSVNMLKNSLEELGHTVYVITVTPKSVLKYEYDEKNECLSNMEKILNKLKEKFKIFKKVITNTIKKIKKNTHI